MWTKTKSLLTLFEWTEILGINPYIVAQIGQPADQIARGLGQCQSVFYQNGGQNVEQLGREEVAQALQDAERLVSKVLNTFPAPTQRSEVLSYPRPANLSFGQLWYGPSARLKSARTDFGRIIATGVYAETLIDDNVNVVASDPNSDGLNTLFTVTVNNIPDGATEDEIVVYFSSADIPASLSRAECEIRPVNVSITGNVATITGNMLSLVRIVNYLKLVPQELNATDNIYATTVDVYRRTIDPAQSGSLIFEHLWRDGCDETPCTYELTTGCFKAIDPIQGWVAPFPAEYDAAEQAFSRLFPDTAFAPDRVELNYVCGYTRENGRMRRPLAQIVAYLATALLPSKSMGCDRADQRLFFYREFPSGDDPKNSGQLQVSPRTIEAANSWFGVSGRGAIRAAAMLMQENLHIYRSVLA